MFITFSEIHQQLSTGLRLGILKFNADFEPFNETVWEQINHLANTIKNTIKLDQVNKQQAIMQTRAGYKKCGKDPNRYRPSADSLYRRIIKSYELYQVNNIVDTLNYISLKSGFSIGGYDINEIQGNILVDIGKTNDHYTGIGRGELNINGLPVLRDDYGVFGNPTSDSVRTMIKQGTGTCMFCFFDFGQNEDLLKILKECKDSLMLYANGKNFEIDVIAQP